MERAALRLLAVAAFLLLASCRCPRLDLPVPATPETTLSPFAGPRDAFRPVSPLLFVHRADVEAWNEGRVQTGHGLRPRSKPPPPNVPAESGFRLRTAHVDVRTNVPWSEAVAVAALAEEHVRLLMIELGAALDLTFPNRPLDVVVHRTRDDYQAALALAIPGHHGWSAWYDDRSRRVHACMEPAEHGALPFPADLRHEMTHQILDAGTPRTGRRSLFEGHGFWLWEGIAVWSETLGDRPGEDTRAARRARFLERARNRELTPLAELVRLPQSDFLGRQYDQVGLLLDHLMADGVPGSRDVVLRTLADALRGRLQRDPFPDRLGVSYAALERQWLNALLAER